MEGLEGEREEGEGEEERRVDQVQLQQQSIHCIIR